MTIHRRVCPQVVPQWCHSRTPALPIQRASHKLSQLFTLSPLSAALPQQSNIIWAAVVSASPPKREKNALWMCVSHYFITLSHPLPLYMTVLNLNKTLVSSENSQNFEYLCRTAVVGTPHQWSRSWRRGYLQNSRWILLIPWLNICMRNPKINHRLGREIPAIVKLCAAVQRAHNSWNTYGRWEIHRPLKSMGVRIYVRVHKLLLPNGGDNLWPGLVQGGLMATKI